MMTAYIHVELFQDLGRESSVLREQSIEQVMLLYLLGTVFQGGLLSQLQRLK